MKKYILLLIAPLLFFNSCEEEELPCYCCDGEGGKTYLSDTVFIIIPNVITPNNDGSNDCWNIRFSSDNGNFTYSEIEQMIITINGQLIEQEWYNFFCDLGYENENVNYQISFLFEGQEFMFEGLFSAVVDNSYFSERGPNCITPDGVMDPLL